MKKVRSVRCPQCGTATPLEADYFPFCSRRCKLLDLGNWLSGEFRIAGEKIDPEAQRKGHDDEV